jgi:hypothetical protein
MEEGAVDKKTFSRRCPSVGEFLAYTSVVAVFLAILIPLEFNYGLTSISQSFKMTTVRKDSYLFLIIEKLGLFNGEPQSPDVEDIFTKEDLFQYRGESEKIYLAFLGMCKLFWSSMGIF